MCIRDRHGPLAVADVAGVDLPDEGAHLFQRVPLLLDYARLAVTEENVALLLSLIHISMVVGREDDVCTTGHIRIGTATPEMLESTVEKGDIVILTNRYESQLCAIEKEASLLIICNGAKVGLSLIHI